MLISNFLIISKEFIQSGSPRIFYKNLLKVPEASSSDSNWSTSKRTKRKKLPLFKRCKPVCRYNIHCPSAHWNKNVGKNLCFLNSPYEIRKISQSDDCRLMHVHPHAYVCMLMKRQKANSLENTSGLNWENKTYRLKWSITMRDHMDWWVTALLSWDPPPPCKQALKQCGSRINTDRFPKRAPEAQASSGARGRAPLGNFFGIFTPQSPFFWVPKSFRQDIGQISTWKKSFFINKNATLCRQNVI